MKNYIQWCLVSIIIIVIVIVCYLRWKENHNTQIQNKNRDSQHFKKNQPHNNNYKKSESENKINNQLHPRISDTKYTHSSKCPNPMPFARTKYWNDSYAPIWIFVNTDLSKTITDWQSPKDITQAYVSTTPPDFDTVFYGYQRLALLTMFMNCRGHHQIIFIHRENWHLYLPNLGNAFNVETLDKNLLHDYVKYQILAYYGGFWLTPDTVVTCDLQSYFNSICKKARKSSLTPSSPLIVVSGKKKKTSAYQTVNIIDDSCLLCEPRNPVMLKIANKLQTIITHYSNYSAYTFDNFACTMLFRYSVPLAYGKLAKSIIRLDSFINGTVDSCNRCVTVSDYFSQRPTCLPHQETKWFVINRDIIHKTKNYHWFLKMTEESIIHSSMWITLLFQYALKIIPNLNQFSDCSVGSKSPTIAIQFINNPLQKFWNQSWKVIS